MPRVAPAFRIHYELQYVGRMIKAAKRQVDWKFAFDGDTDEHSVRLMHTLNSGKKVIFLNGNQIFEDDKMSAGQFVYPFQLDGHLLTVVIEAQVSDEGMYDLRVDGRRFDELRSITLTELRARARGDRDRNAAWNRGGGPAGRGQEDEYQEEAPAEEPAVTAVSLKDFVGESAAPAPAAASKGGAWDPFDGEEGAAPAPAPAPAAAAPPVPVRKATPTTSTSGATALRAPTAGGGVPRPVAHAPAPASAAASAAYDPFGDSVPAPAAAASSSGARRASGGVGGLADDLMGLSFGSAPAPASAARPASGGGGGSHGLGDLDLFGAPAAHSGAPIMMGAHAAAPAPAPAPGLSGGLDDLFGNPAAASSLLDFSGKSGAGAMAAQAGGKPSLAQLAANKQGERKNVMGASAMASTSAAAISTAGGLEFSLGLGGMGAAQPQPAYGGFGAPAPAPAPAAKPAAEYNPFDM